MDKKIKAIVTGSTGMVGEGVLHECIISPHVERALVINRKPCGVKHPKLKEIIVKDFLDLSSVEEELKGYDACFFCLGVSSVGMDPDEYYKTTYTLTLNMAEILSRLNEGMTFNYVSGAGTDSSEKGKLRWARVKGKTENDLMKLPFKQVYAFRPGFIKPTPGLNNAQPFYKYINWMFPIIKKVYPNFGCTLHELGLAMINSVTRGYDKRIIDNTDIEKLAKV